MPSFAAATSPTSAARDTRLHRLAVEILSAELLRCLWTRGRRDVELLRPAVGGGAAELVVSAGGVTRHVHVLTTARGERASRQEVPTALEEAPSGCVIWAEVEPETLALGPFLWFGGAPGAPLPPLAETAAPGPAPTRVLAKMRFSPARGLPELADLLFGPAA